MALQGIRKSYPFTKPWKPYWPAETQSLSYFDEEEMSDGDGGFDKLGPLADAFDEQQFSALEVTGPSNHYRNSTRARVSIGRDHIVRTFVDKSR